MERERDRLQMEIENGLMSGRSTTSHDALHGSATSGDSDVLLKQQMTAMNQRIAGLESQQHDLEIYAGRLLDDHSPPDYSTSVRRAV